MSASALLLATVAAASSAPVEASGAPDVSALGSMPEDTLQALRWAQDMQRSATGHAMTMRRVLTGRLPASGESFPPSDG